MRTPKRKYSKVKTKWPDKAIIFRGKRYYFYRDAYLGSKDLKNLVARLRKDGFKVRLIGHGELSPVVSVYTNPEVTRIPHKPILPYK